MKEEGFVEIGLSIQRHRQRECLERIMIPAIGRTLCDFRSTTGANGMEIFWLINQEPSSIRKPLFDGGKPIYKNSKLGGFLSKYNSGSYSYDVKSPYSKRIQNHVNINILNKATYRPVPNSVEDISIYFPQESRPHIFTDLLKLTQKVQKKNEELEEARRRKEAAEAAARAKEEAVRKAAEAKEKAEKEANESAKKAAEEAARRAEEEARRQAEEAAKKIEEAKKAQEDIDRLEKEINESNRQIEEQKNFIRRGNQLRSQHLLDETQEDAKRSHLFDGVPIVINGGPGTGKTTTMIQRLKFLISEQALVEEETPLNENQIHSLTNTEHRNNNWIFFSPTSLLLHFLRNVMVEEELQPTERNTVILSEFRKRMMNSYKLTNPETDGPFKNYRVKGTEDSVMILNPQQAINDFEKFLVKNITDILLLASNLPTSNFEWHKAAVYIKAECQKAARIKDVNALIKLFDSLKDKERKNVRVIEDRLNELLRIGAIAGLNAVKEDESLKNQVYELFNMWINETVVVDDREATEDEMEEDDEEENNNDQARKIDFDPKLFAHLKAILRNLSLKKYNSKQKLSARQQQLYNIIKPAIDDIDLIPIGELAWFVKNYAFLCRGTESNILNQIPRLYKLFRKKQLAINSANYNLDLLAKVSVKDNKKLHPDEQNLLIGFINMMANGIYRQSKLRFEDMKNQKYIKAYRENVKYVIGVDEATDYSVLDYYFLSSFRHYEFSSITLCGDIMQGLNSNGIRDWNNLKNFVFPELEIYDLAISYRQLPSLVNISRQMYLDDIGIEAPFNSKQIISEQEPAALKFVSADEEKKIHWLTERIIEVNRYYNHDLPSVGIFVGDDVDIDEFIEMIEDQDNLDNINVVNGATSNLTKAVRVFKLSQVKGMEFEVAFFHNIDKATGSHGVQLMRRYLYVGISRASSFLAATFCKEKENEDVLKYFSDTKKNWIY